MKFRNRRKEYEKRGDKRREEKCSSSKKEETGIKMITVEMTKHKRRKTRAKQVKEIKDRQSNKAIDRKKERRDNDK